MGGAGQETYKREYIGREDYISMMHLITVKWHFYVRGNIYEFIKAGLLIEFFCDIYFLFMHSNILYVVETYGHGAIRPGEGLETVDIGMFLFFCSLLYP